MCSMSRPILETTEAQGADQLPASTNRADSSQEPQRKTARGFTHDWAPAALYLLFDSLSWFAIYSVARFLRREGYSAETPLQFFLVDVLQLAVIVAAFFIIGGYDRHTEMRSLC